MSSRPTWVVRVAMLGLLAAIGGCGGAGSADNESIGAAGSAGKTPTGTASFPAPGRISQERSTACLKQSGAEVAAVPRSDSRAAAVADLAQRNSVAVRTTDGNALVIFAANDVDAAFLADALHVSDDPYRMEVVDNAVLLYPPVVEKHTPTVRRCLR